MSEEATLADRARDLAGRLRGHDSTLVNPSDEANLLDQLVDALTKPAPLFPTLQVIAERQAIVRFVRDQGVATMLTASKSAPDGSVDPQASFAAAVALQLAEKIERGDHEPTPPEQPEAAPQADDGEARSMAHGAMTVHLLDGGLLTIDEARAREGLPPDHPQDTRCIVTYVDDLLKGFWDSMRIKPAHILVRKAVMRTYVENLARRRGQIIPRSRLYRDRHGTLKRKWGR